MSSDDKALVPLGIPAAVKQQKILMCMENPVKLATILLLMLQATS